MASQTVPISVVENAADSALATHEILDDAAHQQIATEVDEDYQWLTERLDATNRELTTLRESIPQLLAERTTEILSAFNESREQSRTLIEAQSQMIATLSESLTTLNQSVLLRLTPPNSETSSQNEQPEETITATESVPVEVARTQESNAEENGKKRRRM